LGSETGSLVTAPSSGESANFRFRETDDVKSIEIVDIEPALGEVAYFG
jgi:hypothetical protein